MVTIFWLGFVIYGVADLYGSRRIHTDNPHKSVPIRINPRLRNPIFFTVSIFILLVAISTFFALNPYRAFWGDIERGEGLVSLLFYFGFFIAALITFSEKDWQKFFSLTLVVAALLFLDQLYFHLSGNSLWGKFTGSAPGYVAGNPNFLSPFYLFAIFSAGMLLSWRKKHQEELEQTPNNARNYAELMKQGALILLMLIAAVGIFLSGTRGVIAGLGFGILVVLFYLVYNPHKSAQIRINPYPTDNPHKSAPIRINPYPKQIAVLLLILIAAFGVIFTLTRHSLFWQKIPGLSDIASLNSEDPTLRTRLLAAGSSLRSINPANEGLRRFLFGWGQENFIFAFSKYYDPRFLRYENSWLDRAHNKLLDVLVMNGVLGLLAYIMLWFFVLKTLIYTDRKRIDTDKNALIDADENQRAALLFFGVSYFVQNLFSFDTPITYIPFFAFLAYLASRTRINAVKTEAYGFISVAALLAAIFFLLMLIVTLVAFGQTVRWTKALSTKQAEKILASFDSWSLPYTFAQYEIRNSAIVKAVGIPDLSQPTFRQIFEKSLRLYEEVVGREKVSPDALLPLAAAYEFAGDFASAEKYRKEALELAPRRQELLYLLALNYSRQGKREEAVRLTREMLELDPDSPRSKIYYAVISAMTVSKSFDEVSELVFEAIDGPVKFNPDAKDLVIIRNLFQFYLSAFYRQRNAERFLAVMEAAKRFEARYDEHRFSEIEKGIEAFRARGWEAIREVR
jgi:tetratricopeptide (TPR) repeat protein